MLVRKVSILSGNVHEREIPVEPSAFAAWSRGKDRRLIQQAFPHLSADDREFLLSGITPEEWLATFPPEDDELDEEDF